MDAAERRDFEAMHRRSLEHVREGRMEDYDAANLAFHSALYRGAHNRFLEETTLSVRRRVQPFRRSQFRVLGRLGNSFAEHDRIVEAVLRGDAQAAENSMREHVSKVSVASATLIEGRRQQQMEDSEA
jgi:DNA-binding GntR family transcriptional regulator